MAKGLFADYVKEKKLREPEEKKELAQTYVEARKKGFVQCIIKQLLDSVFAISRIIKVSVRVNPYLDLKNSGYHKTIIQWLTFAVLCLLWSCK